MPGEERMRAGFFFGLFLLLLLINVGTASADTDWQYWNALYLKKSLSEKIDLKLTIYERFDRSMHHLFYAGFQIGPVFKINRYLEVSPSYCYIESKDSKGHFRQEDRPTLDVNFKWKTGILKFTHRSRLEYRFLKALSRYRYRDLLIGGIPFTISKHAIMPYVSGEIFYEERKDEFDQYRLSSGVAINLTKDIVFDIYYLLRSDKASTDLHNWTDLNVLGTSLTFNF